MIQNSTRRDVGQIVALVAIAWVAMIGLMISPTDDNPAWHVTLFGSKALGAAGFYLAYRLERKWRKANRILRTYYAICYRAMGIDRKEGNK